MSTPQGLCTRCESDGPVGQSCASPSCQSRDYRFVPSEYAKRLKQSQVAYKDPNIGLAVGEYLLVDVLGRGAYGRVYLVLQLPILMKAAMKILTYEAADESVQRDVLSKFEQEAISLARLAHPNIVRLHKYGSVEGQPYLVMEFVENARTLKAELDQQILRGGGFDFSLVDHITGQLLNALECAHQQSIVHRDIKPENIMLQRVAGDDYFVRVVDFGLAKFTEKQRNTSYITGTPAYMAPEQITKTNIGPWTDLYAVAAVALEMLLGTRLYTSDNADDVLSMKMDPKYDPLSGLKNLNLGQATLSFFRKALAFKPAKRFQSAAEYRTNMQRVFDSLSKLEKNSVILDDLMSVLSHTERTRLNQERGQLEQDRAEFERQRQLINQERQSLEALRQRLSTELSAPGQLQQQSQPMMTGRPHRQTTADPVRPSSGRSMWVIALVIALGLVLGGGTVALMMKQGSTKTSRDQTGETVEPTKSPGKQVAKTPDKRPSTDSKDQIKPGRNKVLPKPTAPPEIRLKPVVPPSLKQPTPRLTQLPTPRPVPTPTQAPDAVCDPVCSLLRTCLQRVKSADPARIKQYVSMCYSNCTQYKKYPGWVASARTNIDKYYCKGDLGKQFVDPKLTAKDSCESLCAKMQACYRQRYGPQVSGMMKNGCMMGCKPLEKRGMVSMFRISVKQACIGLDVQTP